MIEFGKIYHCQMDRIESQGLVLIEKESQEEIWTKPSLDFPFIKGKELPIFVWMRGEDGQYWGSMQMPKILLGDVEFLRVIKQTPFGIFLDWGLEKELLCPLSHIVDEPRPEMLVAVRLLLDEKTNRLMASMKWKKQTIPADEEFFRSMEVNIQVMETSDMGYVVLVNQEYMGMLYENQIFKPLRIGEKRTGYVNTVREDGKLDILLQRPGYGEVIDSTKQLLQAIENAGGRLPLGDKSQPEEIVKLLNMSKKVFKKSVGALYRNGQIGMSDNSIWKVENDGD